MVKKEAERGKGDLRSPKERKLAIKFFFAWQIFKSTKGLREPLSGPEFMDDPLVERL
jgi:hypothetical protein